MKHRYEVSVEIDEYEVDRVDRGAVDAELARVGFTADGIQFQNYGVTGGHPVLGNLQAEARLDLTQTPSEFAERLGRALRAIPGLGMGTPGDDGHHDFVRITLDFLDLEARQTIEV